jgi:hypothetical protein
MTYNQHGKAFHLTKSQKLMTVTDIRTVITCLALIAVNIWVVEGGAYKLWKKLKRRCSKR